MHVVVDPIKNEGARGFTRFFHYKSIRNFPDAQGQLTPQSLVQSGQISNSFEMLWMPSLPEKIIQSKMSALECSQQFFRRARADNSGVGGGIWPKFELFQAFMHVLVSCKNEVDPIKNEGDRVFTRFFHYKSKGILPDTQGQLIPQSLVRSGQISNSSEMLWMFSLTCKYEEDPIKNEGARVFTRFLPL